MSLRRTFKSVMTVVGAVAIYAVNWHPTTQFAFNEQLFSHVQASDFNIHIGHPDDFSDDDVIDHGLFPDEQPPQPSDNADFDGGESGHEDLFEVPRRLEIAVEKVGFLNESPKQDLAKEHYEKNDGFSQMYDGFFHKGDRLEVIAYYQWLCGGQSCDGLQSFFEVRLNSGQTKFVFRNDWNLKETFATESPEKPSVEDPAGDVTDTKETGVMPEENSTDPEVNQKTDHDTERQTVDPVVDSVTVDPVTVDSVTTDESPQESVSETAPSFHLKSNSKGYSPVPVGRKIFKTKRGGVNSYCGSYHYYAKKNHRSVGGKKPDWNANFKTNNTCAFMLMAEKWNAVVCQRKGKKTPGCRLSFGDASRVKGGPLKGHATHNRGRTVDVRLPMKSNIAFRERNFTYKDRAYSRDMAQKMVDMFKEYGAKVVLFNDPNVTGVTEWKGHANHFHIKFDGTKTAKICKEQKMAPEQVEWRRQCPKLD